MLQEARWGIGKSGDITHENHKKWGAQNKFRMILRHYHGGEERESRPKPHHGNHETTLRVPSERFAIRSCHPAVGKLSVLREPLSGHKERAQHPVSEQHRAGRKRRVRCGVPAQQKSEWIVYRFGDYVKDRNFL